MNKIIVYCGHYKFLSSEIKQTVVPLGRWYNTCEENSSVGHSLFEEDTLNGYDIRYFTNNETVFNGIRLGVKKHGLKAAERLSFIFYDKSGVAHRIKLDSDGNLGYGVPKDGFFDQISKDLIQLF